MKEIIIYEKFHSSATDLYTEFLFINDGFAQHFDIRNSEIKYGTTNLMNTEENLKTNSQNTPNKPKIKYAVKNNTITVQNLTNKNDAAYKPLVKFLNNSNNSEASLSTPYNIKALRYASDSPDLGLIIENANNYIKENFEEDLLRILIKMYPEKFL